jgi:probable DNA metabolism protein
MMYTAAIQQHDGLDEFRSAARKLLAAQIAPSDVTWGSDTKGSLFHDFLPDGEKIASVPRAFAALAEAVSCHRDEQRWSLLYEALWRIDRGERALIQQASDPLVHRLNRMAASVRRDQHRMTAFVRFKMVPNVDSEHFIAWYEPQHFILRRTSSFFVDRFANMLFSILTPDLTLHWNRSIEHFGPGLSRQHAASEDAVEDWWQRYYAAVFNPARANPNLMRHHMPKRFWRDLPEAKIISELLGSAEGRTDRMIRLPNDHG